MCIYAYLCMCIHTYICVYDFTDLPFLYILTRSDLVGACTNKITSDPDTVLPITHKLLRIITLTECFHFNWHRLSNTNA